MDIYTNEKTIQMLGQKMPSVPNDSGDSICGAQLEDTLFGNPICTRPIGHFGLHVAHDTEECAVAIWLNEADPEGIL